MPRRAAATGDQQAPKKRGPKPGFKRVQAVAVAAAVAQAAIAATPPVVQPEPVAQADAGPGERDCLQRGRRIDQMGETELRRYARQLGISQRDADGLTVERLRQNCTAQLYELIDAL